MFKLNQKNWRVDQAADMLRKNGYLIVDTEPSAYCNAPRDMLVAYNEQTNTMFAIQVDGTNALTRHTPDCIRAQRTDAKKRKAVQAMRRWCRVNKWHGAASLSFCAVYGTPEAGRPIIELLHNVANVQRSAWL